MALVLRDRVKETTTTTGTGTVTLAGAVTGFQSFSVVGNANTTYYCIAHQTANEWEVGIGTYTAAGTLLARTTVLESSNAGALVTFSAGTKDVFVTYPAERAIYADGTVLQTTNSAVLPIASGGSGTTTAQLAMNAFAGAVTSGQYLRGNGTNVVMSAIQAADVPTLNQNTTGSAATLTTARTINEVSFNGSANITVPRVKSFDDRTTAPIDVSAGYATFAFSSWANNNTTPYADSWIMRSYTDASGGNDNMVSFRKDALGMRIWQQTYGSATAFATYKDVAWTDGTNATGTWGISISGNAATATSATSATTATNLAGGAANQIHYNTATSTSAYITAPTTASTFLQWNGSAFVWAGAGGGAAITNDTTTNATYYPSFLTATSGSLSDIRVSSTKLTFNPSTGALTTPQLAVTQAGSATTGGGQLYLNGATSNRIDFNTNGFAPPAVATRSIGTKICLYPEVAASTVDYAFGIDVGTLWASVPSSTSSFKWYAATTVVLTLSGGGNLTAAGTITANSDERVKTNWRSLPSDFIQQLAEVKHGTYDRTDQELTQDGVSAQSLQTVLPHSVLEASDGRLSVAYGNAALVSAIEIAKRVVQQEARIAKLEALVAQLTKGNTP